MKILIIINGSIAAVKVPDLVSKLKSAGHQITCAMTANAENFVTSISLSYLTENKVFSVLMDADEESEMRHIKLSRDNDLILVVPATANFMAKIANGICDDLCSTIIMAANKPVIFAPAMNPEMYANKATQRNIKTLKKDGYKFIDPVIGKTACGEVGQGRMAEIEDIVKFVEGLNSSENFSIKQIKNSKLKGLKCLVTSGPTREPIDPVRFISNYSSGKQGYEIAIKLRDFGADVTLISGPTNLEQPENIKVINVESADEMLEKVRNNLPCDVAICAAAVADWKPDHIEKQKIKKKPEQESQTLSLILNPDILYEIGRSSKVRPKLVIGFAAETEHLIENALVKLERKNCDWIIANDVLEGKVFGSDDNSVSIISKQGLIKKIDNQSKENISIELVEMIGEFFNKE